MNSKPFHENAVVPDMTELAPLLTQILEEALWKCHWLPRLLTLIDLRKWLEASYYSDEYLMILQWWCDRITREVYIHMINYTLHKFGFEAFTLLTLVLLYHTWLNKILSQVVHYVIHNVDIDPCCQQGWRYWRNHVYIIMIFSKVETTLWIDYIVIIDIHYGGVTLKNRSRLFISKLVNGRLQGT